MSGYFLFLNKKKTTSQNTPGKNRHMKIYNFIEQTFFFTLTRKIIGNLSFLFLLQSITLFWLYLSLTQQKQQGIEMFWLLVLVISIGFIFTVFYMRFLIVRPVTAMRDTLIKVINKMLT